MAAFCSGFHHFGEIAWKITARFYQPLLFGTFLFLPLPGVALPVQNPEPNQVLTRLLQEYYPELAPPEMILPEVQTLRITIDLSDRRLTLYDGDTVLRTIPVAVGRDAFPTPMGEFEVQQMIRDPSWMNPFTHEVIEGGHPRNPLGRFWIGFWTDGNNWVGMHGTPNPESVGNAVSHGCIRLYDEDIQALFSQVTMGTPVTVVP